MPEPVEVETVAYLGLGSNEGDRLANLRRGVSLLDTHPQIKVVSKSRIYASQSVEGGGENNFLNAVARVVTTLGAADLLRVCQGVEETLGRPAPPRTGSRPIDVDILLFGDEQYSGPELNVPHPRALHRAFVLRPLLDVLEGGWIEPTAETW
jgi:2-amino-4-hydroxy-6-hydroxymethyldihydropteridine diphosphokinase